MHFGVVDGEAAAAMVDTAATGVVDGGAATRHSRLQYGDVPLAGLEQPGIPHVPETGLEASALKHSKLQYGDVPLAGLEQPGIAHVPEMGLDGAAMGGAAATAPLPQLLLHLFPSCP